MSHIFRNGFNQMARFPKVFTNLESSHYFWGSLVLILKSSIFLDDLGVPPVFSRHGRGFSVPRALRSSCVALRGALCSGSLPGAGGSGE